MPEMWIDVDTAVAVPVNILPLIDDGDFKSREVAIVYGSAGMDLVWNFVTSAGEMTQTGVTPTTSGIHDWTHVGDGMYKIEIPLSGGTINNDAEGYGWFSGICDGVLPWRGPVMGFRAAALNDALCDGGDTLDTNVTAMANDVLTAAAIADDAFVAANFATGCLTADAFAADALIAATFATGAFTADAFAADALVAATFATGAFTADAFAANALVAGTFAASSLNGKGNWNTVTPPTAAAVKTEIEQGGSTLAQILTDTAVIGALGAGLTGLGGMSATMKAQIKTEVNAAIDDTAISELSVGVPAKEPTLRTGLMLLYMALRNKLVVQTSGTDALEIYNDAGTKIAKKLLSDDGSDYTEAKATSGA